MNNTLFRLLLILALTMGLSATANAVAVIGQGDWETTLQARYLDSNPGIDAYYDTFLDITWLADANAAGTTMTWVDANNWAGGLDFDGDGISDGWRLPTIVDTGAPGCERAAYNYIGGTDCGYNVQTASRTTVYSEMASMFYDTLGNLAYYDTSGSPQPGWGLTNTGPFSNLQSDNYWSATAYVPSTYRNYAWFFGTDLGYQYYDIMTNVHYAWAVHSGDVGASVVPVPAAVWLLGSGLIGLVGVARRCKS